MLSDGPAFICRCRCALTAPETLDRHDSAHALLPSRSALDRVPEALRRDLGSSAGPNGAAGSSGSCCANARPSSVGRRRPDDAGRSRSRLLARRSANDPVAPHRDPQRAIDAGSGSGEALCNSRAASRTLFTQGFRMPRRSKGPRLYLRSGRTDPRSGKALPDLYYIRDGSRELGTGCGHERLREAEQLLAAYIAEKWAAAEHDTRDGPNHPADVLVAEVLALYIRERAPRLSDPVSRASSVKALLGWWGEKHGRGRQAVKHARRMLKPTAWDPSRSRRPRNLRAARKRHGPRSKGARRELEDLSAAIGHWHGEHPLIVRPKVWLPDKPESPRDALTRSLAAALLPAPRMAGRTWPDGRWTADCSSAPRGPTASTCAASC